MDKATHALFRARAEVLKALAHPTRLFIVSELQKGERCVCALVDLIGADFSTVSKHLLQLKRVGILEDEKRGLQVFYRLRTPCALRFLDCIERVLRDRAKADEELLKA